MEFGVGGVRRPASKSFGFDGPPLATLPLPQCNEGNLEGLRNGFRRRLLCACVILASAKFTEQFGCHERLGAISLFVGMHITRKGVKSRRCAFFSSIYFSAKILYMGGRVHLEFVFSGSCRLSRRKAILPRRGEVPRNFCVLSQLPKKRNSYVLTLVVGDSGS